LNPSLLLLETRSSAIAEIARFVGYYEVQGHSRLLILMAVENTYIGLFIFWVLYGILTKIINVYFHE